MFQLAYNIIRKDPHLYSTQLHQVQQHNATSKRYDNRRVMRSFQVKLLFFYLVLFPDLHCLTFIMSPPAGRVYLSLFSYLPRAGRHRFLAAIKAALRPATRLPRVPLYKLTSIIIIPLVRRSGSLRIFLTFPAICSDPFT